ncbi:SWIM zinc finger family protein [Streptomyces ovatisporus]|uniref:SWIM zinc finger family protein n=1 Tax=Streptomyces ovatisporus TaxID=1128682 RepID=A0ABV8ZZR2_9ACTN
MTEVGARWTAEQVMTLAPDAASGRAGSKLAGPDRWPESGSGEGAVWGLCRGSGSKPYQTVVDLGGDGEPGFKCSCPSRKFPCKHALGLLLLWTGNQAGADGQAPPEWAGKWLEGRRERAARKAAGSHGRSRNGDGAAADGSAGADTAGVGRPADPEAARRRAERRIGRIAAGAAELEERLADLLRGGLAEADRHGRTAWEETAARMVDAQAPGLAARIRDLGALPASAAGGRTEGPGGGWPGRLLSECALLHLLNRGFLALESLPEPLAATVRTRVGLTVDSSELLADETARARDEWLVLAQRDTDEGRLTARRTWLYGRATERPALLLSFAPSGRRHEVSLPVGSSVDAELAYHPGARPLRAALGERYGSASPGCAPPGGTVTDALAGYGAALCDDPWLEAWPSVLTDVVPIAEKDGSIVQLADAAGDFALPVAPGTSPGALWRLMAVSGGHPVTVFGECGHRGFAPYTVWNSEDGGTAVEAVQL